jgi:6,7-dimethyl-8-ribityllumazine synthase
VATSLSSLPRPTFTYDDNHYKIGIVTAAWNGHITEVLKNGAIETLEDASRDQSLEIIEFPVPGAFEIPTAAQWLFEHGCDAVINLGCVIKGDTPHFEYVCNAVTDGIAQLALKYSKPCIFGVITTNTEQQALDRAGGSLGNKGSEAAEAALWMLMFKSDLDQ